MNTKRLAWLMVFVLLVGALPALAQDGGNLDATFEAEDGTFSFAYPSAWYADNFFIPGLFIVATNESEVEQMMAEGPIFPSGEMLLTMLSPQASSLVFEGSEPITIDDALALLLINDADTTEFGEPEAITIGDYDALVSGAVAPEGEGLAIVIEVNNGVFVLTSAIAAPGEFGVFEDTIMAILATITYTTSGGMVAFATEAGDLALEYPAGWSAFESSAGSITIMNEISLDTVHPGQVLVYIKSPPVVESFLEDAVSGLAEPIELMANFWADGRDKELGEVSEVMVGDYEGDQLNFSTAVTEGYILALDIDGETLVVLVTVATGELVDFDAEVTAILESLEYTPIEGGTE